MAGPSGNRSFAVIKPRRWRPARGMIIGFVLVAYVLSYGAVRAQRILVHRKTYVTENGRQRFFHSVVRADLGPGVFHGPVAGGVVEGSYWVFTPVRLVEAGVWFCVPEREGFFHERRRI